MAHMHRHTWHCTATTKLLCIQNILRRWHSAELSTVRPVLSRYYLDMCCTGPALVRHGPNFTCYDDNRRGLVISACAHNVNYNKTKSQSLSSPWRHNNGTLYHANILNLVPSRPTVISQRHFSRETLAYYLSSEYPPIGYAQSLLMNVHGMTGLPWWATIALTTFFLRTVITLPLFIYSAHVLAHVEKLGPEISALAKELKVEVAVAVKKYEWDNKVARYHYNSNVSSILNINCYMYNSNKSSIPTTRVPPAIVIM